MEIIDLTHDIKPAELTGLVLSFTALLISIVALIYTIRAYLLKSGNLLRCDISTCSSMDCEDNYISSINLENLKDRATVIFDIYLKIGNNNYLLIETFKEAPLILKPFEVYYKKYDPVILYSANMYRMSLNTLLDNRKTKRRVVLSTTNGKYYVKANTKHWRPEWLFFKNHRTAIIEPQRYTYKGVAYGSNVKFLLVLKAGEHEDVIPIKDSDITIQKFTKFSLTSESLSSKASFEKFITLQQKIKKLTFDDFEVIDFGVGVKRIQNEYDPTVEAEADGFFQYNVLGRIGTILADRKLDKENRERAKKHKKSHQNKKIES